MRHLGTGLWHYRGVLLVVLTPLCLSPLPVIVKSKEAECAFVLLLMAVYWVTEVLPLSVTALLPAVLLPLFGIMKSSEVASMYYKDFHFLLIGVICLATSIEKWGLHRRIALRLVTLVGVDPAWLMLGFMCGCAFLSMWVHNISAVTMVMPIVEAVIQQVMKAGHEVTAGTDNLGLQLNESNGSLEKKEIIESKEQNIDTVQPVQTVLAVPDERSSHIQMPSGDWASTPYRSKRDHNICKALCLSIAYSSSIGGISTLMGTSPNLIFSQFMKQVYPECNSINFGSWLLLCLPISIIMLLLSWIWLHLLFIGSDFRFLWRCKGESLERDRASARLIKEEYRLLGPISSQEVVTEVLFMLMVALWFTREPGFMPGWASLFPEYKGYATDGTAALLLGILLFIIPCHRSSSQFEPMISWKEFQASMPWEVALLVGGGFALAEGTQVSGLSTWVAGLLTPLGGLPVLATVTVACLIVTTVTEVASNAATMTIFLPILAPLAEAVHVNPLYILIPATLCTSFSFLLPISNPVNAVVFGYGHLNTMDMVKAGLGMNVIGFLSVLLAITTWGVDLFSLTVYPEWAPQLNRTGTLL